MGNHCSKAAEIILFFADGLHCLFCRNKIIKLEITIYSCSEISFRILYLPAPTNLMSLQGKSFVWHFAVAWSVVTVLFLCSWRDFRASPLLAIPQDRTPILVHMRRQQRRRNLLMTRPLARTMKRKRFYCRSNN